MEDLNHRSKVRSKEIAARGRSGQRKPFSGKRFYLDLLLPSDVILLLKSQTEQLGGIVEEFFSREVDYLVTQCSSDPMRTSGGTSLPTSPSPGTSRSQNPDSPAARSPALHSPQSFGPEKSVPSLSRGQMLLQQASLVGPSRPPETAAKASSWGIPVMPFRKFLQTLKKFLPLEEEESVAPSKQTPAGGLPKVRKLARLYMKVEDVSRLYRPLLYETKAWPLLCLDCDHLGSPFDCFCGRDLPSSSSLSESRSNQSLGPVNKSSNPKIFLKSKQKDGFCECCQESYGSLMESADHIRYGSDDSHYSSLDKVLKNSPNLEEFLKAVRSTRASSSSLYKDSPSSIDTADLATSGGSSMQGVFVFPAVPMAHSPDQVFCSLPPPKSNQIGLHGSIPKERPAFSPDEGSNSPPHSGISSVIMDRLEIPKDWYLSACRGSFAGLCHFDSRITSASRFIPSFFHTAILAGSVDISCLLQAVSTSDIQRVIPMPVCGIYLTLGSLRQQSVCGFLESCLYSALKSGAAKDGLHQPRPLHKGQSLLMVVGNCLIQLMSATGSLQPSFSGSYARLPIPVNAWGFPTSDEPASSPWNLRITSALTAIVLSSSHLLRHTVSSSGCLLSADMAYFMNNIDLLVSWSFFQRTGRTQQSCAFQLLHGTVLFHVHLARHIECYSPTAVPSKIPHTPESDAFLDPNGCVGKLSAYIRGTSDLYPLADLFPVDVSPTSSHSCPSLGTSLSNMAEPLPLNTDSTRAELGATSVRAQVSANSLDRSPSTRRSTIPDLQQSPNANQRIMVHLLRRSRKRDHPSAVHHASSDFDFDDNDDPVRASSPSSTTASVLDRWVGIDPNLDNICVAKKKIKVVGEKLFKC